MSSAYSLEKNNSSGQMSYSVPNITVGNSQHNGANNQVLPPPLPSTQPPQTVSQNNYNRQSSGVFVDEEDLSKMKLNNRRKSKTERRYHTADSIQEMKHPDKDSSILKRYSWRQDVNNDNSLKSSSKVFSSDSVRSAPSSSGVSSTGSLHLNPESDISEEVEGRYGSVSTFKSGGQTRLCSVGDAEDIDNIDAGYLGSELSSNNKQNMSKSTPDLIEVFNNMHVSKMQDGIASVEVNNDGGSHKLTQADILKHLKQKQQVLYDTELESSEVWTLWHSLYNKRHT